MDEIQIKRALLSLTKLVEIIEDNDTREALIVIFAVLIEHNKSIQELVDAGDC